MFRFSNRISVPKGCFSQRFASTLLDSQNINKQLAFDILRQEKLKAEKQVENAVLNFMKEFKVDTSNPNNLEIISFLLNQVHVAKNQDTFCSKVVVNDMIPEINQEEAKPLIAVDNEFHGILNLFVKLRCEDPCGSSALGLKGLADTENHFAATLYGLLLKRDSKEEEDNAAKYLEQSREWLVSESENGNPFAQTALGLSMYSCSEAMKWFRKAATKGIAEAQYQLGYFYRYKRADSHDGHFADWLKMAAEQGHVEAQYSLGHCNFHGYGMDENIDEAKKWIQLAADQGHKKAQRVLQKEGSKMK